MKEHLRQLPPVHELQRAPQFAEITESFSLTGEAVTALLQEQMQHVRGQLLAGSWEGPAVKEELAAAIFAGTREAASQLTKPFLRPVINGTGTVLHTNLGRARLSGEAVRHAAEIASFYSNTELDLQTGKRGSRHDIVESLLCRLTGAEAAMVVNNNAAAVYLILRGLAKGREVIVSRGELVEIGGSFRVSSIMEESGAMLKEVGTTNKTHLYDYENAISEGTAMLMKVHTSNFKIIGFTKSVSTEELVSLRQQHDVLYYEDLGSGDLLGYRHYGIGEEPVVREVIEAGADLVSFSGDKLLGGPQAGIIAGKKELIAKLKKHQLARVLRVDKMTLAALEATLLSYVRGEAGMREIPTVQAILEHPEHIRERAEQFRQELEGLPFYSHRLEESTSMIGGGTMPDAVLPTYAVVLRHAGKSAAELAAALRGTSVPVIVRVQEDQVWLDFRTIPAAEVPVLLQSLQEVM
ncbi:L-seryl-tRNA(Sec) selenium transferase [Ectobacillus ponti]|uniref:L-seryl-tRNA(Sec) selenium transferase n=1 Tax=Ectobacillus ponti TaxID=2961894 RepID=A0AA41X322_9BACI|nr:L-seryl-tRNA(Sec) selenium transferase [Ectobacillus ponti]MCP8968031.1 L-seryl-tRNA(Sec) selenium transferase [Ectobacillus ponti]